MNTTCFTLCQDRFFAEILWQTSLQKRFTTSFSVPECTITTEVTENICCNFTEERNEKLS